MTNHASLSADWKDITELSVYGFGRVGQGTIDLFVDKFNVKYIIDNNAKYRGQYYRNIPIVDFDFYKKSDYKGKIVILAGGLATESISKTLSENEFVQGRDFCDVNQFCQDWFWEFHGQACVARINSLITTRCTLNCEKCCLLIPYHKRPLDFNMEQLKIDADLFFQSVDYVSNFAVLGGEPLLSESLVPYLEYLGSNYKTRIGSIQVITNGTLLPSRELLEVIKTHNVEVRISDYTSQVQYKERLDQLLQILKRENVKYTVFQQTEWWDIGFPETKVNMGETKEELRQHMLGCQPFCQEIFEGKLYYCNFAWSAQQCGLFQLAEGDSLDLNSLKDDPLRKKKLLDFYFGNLENGYMSFCKVCRGFGANNKYWVPGGVQKERHYHIKEPREACVSEEGDIGE